MFYFIGICISFFLALLLGSKKNKSLPDKILTLWLFIMGIHLLLFYFSLPENIFLHPWLLGILMPMPLLHGPLLLMYAVTITNQFPSNRKLLLLHFVPPLISYLYLIKFFLLPAEQKIYIFQNKGVGYEAYQVISLAAIIISGFTYVIWSSILLKKHQRSILNQFSYTEKINLKWLQYLIYGITLIWILVLTGRDELIFGGTVFFILFIGYFGIKQVGIFSHTTIPVNVNFITDSKNFLENDLHDENKYNTTSQENIPESPIPDEEFLDNSSTNKRKYLKSGLNDDAAIRLHEKLIQIINSERIYKESELTLTELAKRLGTHPNYLSQIINEKEGKNFYDYINTERVKEFKKIVTNPGNQNFTLLSLAYECGFNSKSSFNKYFRKMTGQSPSEFLEQQNFQQN